MSYTGYEQHLGQRQVAQQDNNVPLPSLSSASANMSMVTSPVGYQPPHIVPQHTAHPFGNVYPVYSPQNGVPNEHHLLPPPPPPIMAPGSSNRGPSAAQSIHSGLIPNVYSSGSYAQQHPMQQNQSYAASAPHTPMANQAAYQPVDSGSMIQRHMQLHSKPTSDVAQPDKVGGPESLLRQKSAPDFACKLYRILQEPSFRNIVCWGSKGDSFVVRSSTEFSRVVLPQYFKHNNWASFVRQLNKYDFHKLKVSPNTKKFSPGCWEFQHPHFRYNDLKGMAKIRRKTAQRLRGNLDAQSSETTLANKVPIKEIPSTETSSIEYSIADIADAQGQLESPHLGREDSNDPELLHDKVIHSPSALSSNNAESPDNERMGYRDSDLILKLNQLHQSTMEALARLQQTVEVVSSQSNENSALLLQILSRLPKNAQVADAGLKKSAAVLSARQTSPSAGGTFLRDSDRRGFGSADASGTDSFSLARPSSNADTKFEVAAVTKPVKQVSSSSHLTRLFELGGRSSAFGNALHNDPGSLEKFAAAGNVSVSTITDSLHLRVPWSRPPRVLLVEDDVVSRRLSSRLLHVFGCSYDVATDGADAIEKINSGNKYDIVLMDIVMPKMDGLSATSLIRQIDRCTPIISMTSNVSDDDCVTYLATGMNDILPKPFNKATLLMTLEKYCSRSPSPLITSETGSIASDKNLSSLTLQVVDDDSSSTSKTTFSSKQSEDRADAPDISDSISKSIEASSSASKDDLLGTSKRTHRDDTESLEAGPQPISTTAPLQATTLKSPAQVQNLGRDA